MEKLNLLMQPLPSYAVENLRLPLDHCLLHLQLPLLRIPSPSLMAKTLLAQGFVSSLHLGDVHLNYSCEAEGVHPLACDKFISAVFPAVVTPDSAPAVDDYHLLFRG